jgi:hypothetical protein
MKTKLYHLLTAVTFLALLSASFSTAHAQGTAFTYQGLLTAGGNDAQGSYDLTFALFNAASGGTQTGSTITNVATPVTNGVFSVSLDFGDVFEGTAYWLQIGVRSNGTGSFKALSPRQEITPTPYAIYAEGANATGLTGTVPIAQLPTSLSLLTDPGTGNIFLGKNTGNPAVTGTHNTAAGDSALNNDTSGGGNTAFGYDALDDDTTGDYNTANGFQSLLNNLGGNNNSAYGVNTLYANTAGSDNTAVGNDALEDNSSGSNNVAVGFQALLYSTGDNGIVAVGYNALESNTFVGGFFGTSGNTAVGYEAMQGNTSGSGNTALGWLNLNNNVTGYNDTSTGFGAMVANTSGHDDTADGFLALEGNQTGTNDTAVGSDALAGNTTGPDNTAIGGFSMQSTTSGDGNTALGANSLQANTTGYNNTALGYTALESATGVDNVAVGVNCLRSVTGSVNTAVGTYALQGVTAGAGNIALGIDAGYDLNTGSNNIYIGNLGGSSENGIIRIGQPGTQTATYLTGTVYVPVLSITSGSDLAEPFKVTSGQDELPDGSVMVIDVQHPGQLKVSCQPYDSHVAGILSGANGIHPGIQLQQQGLLEGGRNVALTGRVYVQADTSNGPIEPGDLLTTAATPGHAMKVTDHARAQGAILGKAMTGLSEGNGMVLVLVSLQ